MSFEYISARTVEEAVALAEPDTRYLAGGTDLLPKVRAGKYRVSRVIDIKGIPELGGICETQDRGLKIGAAVTLSEVARHEAVRSRFPLLARCCLAIGAWPLRNRATLVGNVCNASPAADSAPALLALDASFVVVSRNGTRMVHCSNFFRGPGICAVAEGDLVAAVLVPGDAANIQGNYLRISRRRGMDLATVGVLVGRGPMGHRVCLAAVAPVPLRVRDAEAALDAGKPNEAAAIARAAASPITDLRGTAEYRREMVGVLVRRGAASLDAEQA